LIGHSTGRRSLSTVGGHTCCVPPNRGERSTRMALRQFRYVTYVPYVERVALDGNPA